MAIGALHSGQLKSVRAASITFEASRSSIHERMNSISPHSEYIPKSKILAEFEEGVLIKYLMDKDD